MNAELEFLEADRAADPWRETSQNASFVNKPSYPKQATEVLVPQKPERQTTSAQLARWRHGGINE